VSFEHTSQTSSPAIESQVGAPRAGPTLFEVRDEYLRDLFLRVSPHYYTGAKSRLAIMLAQIGNLPVSELRAMDVIRFRNTLKASGASHATCNSYTHHTFKAMLRWAYDAGLTVSNPVHGLKRLPQSRDCATFRRRALSEEEITRFIAAAETDDHEFGRIEAMRSVRRIPQTPLWVGFLETGARWNELRQLTWRDVDFERAVLTLRAENTKSRKARAIPLREGFLFRLRALAKLHDAVTGQAPLRGANVFLSPRGDVWTRPSCNVMRIFTRVLARAKIARVDPEGGKLDIHALRHTFASRLCRAGVGLVHAQNLLGHSDPRLTAAIYTHLDVEDLRKAVQTLPGTADWMDRGTSSVR
jgi:integrase